jgi:ABC-type transport system substrate-binding protein
MKNWRWAGLLAVVLMLGLLVGACGSATDETTVTTATGPTATGPTDTTAVVSTDTTAVAGGAKYGGILVTDDKAFPAEYAVPWLIRGPQERYMGLAMDPLFMGTEEVGVYKPMLAESWELAPDKSSYTFHLRQGVKFHDGTDFNAAAAKFNLDKVKEAGGPWLTKVTSVEVVDDYTLKLNLSGWDVMVLDDLKTANCYIASPTAYETLGEQEMQHHPVGTGPFMYESYTAKQDMTFVKNPNYWMKDDAGQSLPYLDGVKVLSIPDDVTRELKFRNGDMDYLQETSVATAIALQEDGWTLADAPLAGKFMFWFNSTDPTSVFSKPQVRLALEYAINKEEMASTIGASLVEPSYEVIYGMHDLGDPGTTPRKYDPEKAKQLLTEAGYPDGFDADMVLDSKFNGDFVVAIQQYASKVGINLTINAVDSTKWNEMRFSEAPVNTLMYDRQRGGGVATLRQTFSDFGGGTFIGVALTPGFAEGIATAIVTEDGAAQYEALKGAEQAAYADGMTIGLFKQPDNDFINPYVKWNDKMAPSWRTTSGQPIFQLQYVWLDK